jgi:hypothetical protein
MISGTESGGIPGGKRSSNLTFIYKELRVEGFLVSTRWADRWTEVLTALI